MDKLTQFQQRNQRRERFAGMTEVQILQSVRALKGHFTRYTTEAAALMTTLAAAPNAKSLERLEELLDKITEKQNEFDAAHEVLGGMEDVNHDKHNAICLLFVGKEPLFEKRVWAGSSL